LAFALTHSIRLHTDKAEKAGQISNEFERTLHKRKVGNQPSGSLRDAFG